MTTTGTAEPRRSRKVPILIAGLVVAVVAGWSIWWMVAIRFVETKLDQAIVELARNGTAVTCWNQSTGGWPFRLDVACTPVAVKRADGTSLSVPAARAVALAYMPNHVILEADGPATVDLRGLTPGGRANWSLGHASLKVSTDGLARLAIAAENPTLEGFAPLGLRTGLKATLASLYTRRNPSDPTRMDVAATLSGLNDSTGEAGPPIDIELRLTVPDPTARKAGAPLALTGASDAIEITRADLVGGATRVGLAGSLQLDAFATPTGKLMLSVEDPDGLKALLQRVLPPQSPLADAITGAVTGFGKTTEKDGRRIVELPVTVTDGAVSLGLIPLGRLPRAR